MALIRWGIFLAVAGLLALLVAFRERAPGPTLPLSAITATTAPQGLPRAENETYAPKAFGEVLVAVDRLGEEDQEGLEELYRSMERLIRRDEARFHEFFRAFLPHAEKTSADRSLFLAHALVHYARTPEPSLSLLLETRPEPAARDAHAIEARNLSLMKIHALGEAEKKGREWKGTPVGESLTPLFAKIARTEKDLAVTREAVRALGALSTNPTPYYQQILEARDERERIAFADLMTAP